MYLLFWSKHCKYSAHFIKILKDTKEDKFFTLISVDKQNGKRPAAVSEYKVKEIPTIVVDGKTYNGKDAFKWLERKIKNMNHQVSSQNTRVNRNVVTGFSANNSSQSLGQQENFDGTSSYASLSAQFSIETPPEGEEVEKPTFILPNDSLTGGVQAQPGEQKKDKTSIAHSQFDKLQEERERQDQILKQPRRL